MSEEKFELSLFIPYLLNQAAESTSRDFEKIYRNDFGITRCQWRIMANLGKYGGMPAKDIGLRINQNKTSVSRAVFALEEMGLLTRKTLKSDRRSEELQLTENGREIYRKLGIEAIAHNQNIFDSLGNDDAKFLIKILERILTQKDRN